MIICLFDGFINFRLTEFNILDNLADKNACLDFVLGKPWLKTPYSVIDLDCIGVDDMLHFSTFQEQV